MRTLLPSREPASPLSEQRGLAPWTSTRPRQARQPALGASMGSPPSADQRRLTDGLLVVLVMVAVLLAAAIVVMRSDAASYTATVTNISALDADTVVATIQVTNLGSHSARPACAVDLSSSAAAFTGSASCVANQPVAAGSEATYYVEVPVTADGATRVNPLSSTVSCR